MEIIIEAVPIVLAFYAAIACAYRYTVDRRKNYKKVLLLGVVSSILLIIAQSSWYVASVLQSKLVGTEYSEHLWIIFNILTMIAFILLARGGTTDAKEPTTSGN